jgi:hypothetical protein
MSSGDDMACDNLPSREDTDDFGLNQPQYSAVKIYKICEEYDFFVVINNSKPFKHLFELIQSVLTDIDIIIIQKVNKSGQVFKGITINSIDTNKVCMVVGQVKANEVFPESLKETHFVVNSALFCTLLASIREGCCLEIKRRKGEANVIICANPKGSDEVETSIPTLDVSVQSQRLNPIDFKFLIDINLKILKNIVRLAKNAIVDSHHVEFRIHEGKNHKKGTKITLLRLTVEGTRNTKMTHSFRSVTKWDKDSPNQTVITTTGAEESDDKIDDDDVQMEEVFLEKYATKYLDNILKATNNMRENITLRMCPTRPLVMMFPLPGEGELNYAHFILAPTISDDAQ